MRAFYTILYCPIRPVIDERLSVALLVKGDNKVYFKYSSEKLRIIKGLLPEPAFNLLRTSLRNIYKLFDDNKKVTTIGLFPDEEIPLLSTNILDENYINYLSNYTNNLLNFSKPKEIDVDVNEDAFNKLYEKLIFTLDRNGGAKRDFEKIKDVVNPLIEPHVNIDIELTSKQITNLIVPTPLWFIGKNEQDVTGEAIDFDKATRYLEQDIREHLYLLQVLRDSKKNYHGKHFVVGTEPDQSNQISHSIWNSLRNLPYITYLLPDEIGQITEYVKEHQVEPYFKGN